jgi:hypothetical protein
MPDVVEHKCLVGYIDEEGHDESYQLITEDEISVYKDRQIYWFKFCPICGKKLKEMNSNE